MERDKKFCPISIMSKAEQMICCNSKKLDRNNCVIKPLFSNKSTGTSVRISCHMTMCWYELTVKFLGPALAGLNGPVDRTLGCCACAPRLKAHYWQNQGSIYFEVGSFSLKT